MKQASTQSLVLFDGVCNLCESTVRFIIARDRHAAFTFASLQSPIAADLIRQFDYRGDGLDSFLFITGDRLYQKSRAAMQVARRLDGGWPLLYYLFFWVPPFLGDPVYNFIGNRRYKWFGKKEECWIPDDNLRSRFID